MSREDNDKPVVKLMIVHDEARPSLAPVRLPRKLLAGLMLLGFGAVFGVLGMFVMPHSVVAGVTLIALGGSSAISGVVLVMRYAGDARFDPKPVVASHARDDSKP